jgi:hypothetical protein
VKKWVSLIKWGYTIDIDTDAPLGVELEDEVYGVVFDDGASPILLWTPSDPTKHIETIIDDINDRVGSSFNNYTIFKTKESNITLSTRITKSWKLPKNVVNIQFKSEFVDGIVSSKDSKIIDNQDIDDSVESDDKAQEEIIKMISLTNKFRNVAFGSYFQTVYFNAFPDWRKVKGNELKSLNKEFMGETYPDDLTDESVQAIYNSWLGVSDTEIKRSGDFKSVLVDMKWAKFKGVLGDREQEAIKNNYNRNWEMRVDANKYKKLLYSFLETKLKKDFDKQAFKTFYDKLFVGTWLEQ